MSVALADTVTVPETVAPAAGAVMETVGGVVSAEPVPESPTAYALPIALIVSVPVAFPATVGAKTT